jgi:hypothetical protein
MNLQICTIKGEDLFLRDVSTFLVDAELIRVLFNNGKQQNYPLQNIRWYGPEDPVFAPTPRPRPLLARATRHLEESFFPIEGDDSPEYNFNHPTPTNLLLTQHHQEEFSD